MRQGRISQDVCIGGGATGNVDEITMHRLGAVNVRAASRHVCDPQWARSAAYPVDGVRMRDWLADACEDRAAVADDPGVLPVDCLE